jgi:acyl-CoA dehydrogenase
LSDLSALAGFDARVDSALSGADEGDARRVWETLGACGIVDSLYHADAHRLDHRRLDVLLTALDARASFGVVLSVCVQVATVIPILRESAAEHAIARDMLARLIRGEIVVAFAVTDHGLSGSALLGLRTAVSLGPRWAIVAGGKDWITNAVGCDHALVLCRFRPARHFSSFCWVLVPADCPGVTAVPAGGQPFASAGLGHLRFEDVSLSAGHVVGRPGRALLDFAKHVTTERLAGAMWSRALCRRVLRDTRAWLMRRQGLTGPLWDNAAVRERYARCLVELTRIDAIVEALVGRVAARGSGGLDLAVKASVGESVDLILGGCAALRGADSLREGGEAWLRAAASVFALGGGATGAMLAGVADHAEVLLADPARARRAAGGDVDEGLGPVAEDVPSGRVG